MLKDISRLDQASPKAATADRWQFTGFWGNDNFNKYSFFRRYLVKVPEGYPLEKAGPIFCAGFLLQINYIFNISPPLSEYPWYFRYNHCQFVFHHPGITMYSPLSHWGCLAGGKRVGIVGIGGLGQMGVSLVIVVMMRMVVMVQSIFLSIFFLRIKSGFYNWSQSKILL